MKKKVKKFLVILMVLSISLSYVFPVVRVIALDDETSLTFRFTVEDNSIGVKVDNNRIAVIEATQEGEQLHKIDVMENESDQSEFTSVTCHPAEDEANAYCEIVVPTETAESVWFRYDNWFDVTEAGKNQRIGSGNVYSEDKNFDIKPGIKINDNSNEHHFDGKAYVLWSCGSGVCYHYFDDIPGFDDGNSTFYKDTSITANNDESIHFDIYADYKAWALPDRFERWVQAYKDQNNIDEINWENVDPEDIISEYPPNMNEWKQSAIAEYEEDNERGCREPNNNAPREDWDEFDTCVDEYYISQGKLPFIRLQPLGEPDANNSYVSYGDRNFKVVIYNSNYKGVTIGNLDDLNFYPSDWTNPFLKVDQYDISGTTKEKPTSISTILLEKTVNIKSLWPNDFEIEEIKALDVPEGAVLVNKVDDEFKLVFSSNFYDKVTFEVTDTNGNKSYMQINRFTIDAWFRMIDEHPYLYADFYFDSNKSYDDFEITAKIYYKDGTIKNVELTPQNGLDNGLGDVSDENSYEFNEEAAGGKGLKRAAFTYQLKDGEDRKIKKIYLNAEYKGSTEYKYAGAYVGSGEGTLANIYQPGEEE